MSRRPTEENDNTNSNSNSNPNGLSISLHPNSDSNSNSTSTSIPNPNAKKQFTIRLIGDASEAEPPSNSMQGSQPPYGSMNQFQNLPLPPYLSPPGSNPNPGLPGLPYDSATLKVSGASKPKSVAGKIAHMARSGDAPTIMAIGAQSINQTVKSIAIARSYLKDNDIDLMCFPKFQRFLTARSGEAHPVPIAFELQKSALVPDELESTREMKVAQRSEPGPVAGAIAGQIRAGERVCLLAIGPTSVSQSVKAISIARRHLADGQAAGDGREAASGGIDVSFRPEFIHIPYDDDGEQKQRSAIRFKLYAQQIA